MFTPLSPARADQLKRSYTTRMVPQERIAGVRHQGTPESGDVVVARVLEVGQHTRLEAPDGRRQTLFPGDEIMVCFANRYAPAQYEAVVPEGLGICDLVAAGGVAATALSWHAAKDAPTVIDVIGFACDDLGRKINLEQHRIPSSAPAGLVPVPTDRPHTVVVCGTSMDSGKTTAAAGMIRGLVGGGLDVGAAKVTGTGAGGDVWLMRDAGARPVMDFTAVGMASTYLMSHDRIVDSFVTLTDELYAVGIDVAVIEIADGLFFDETRDLLDDPALRDRCDALVFAAGDAIGAQAGVQLLQGMDLPVRAVSGLLTASPLAIREAQGELDVPVLDLEQLWTADHDLVDGAACRARLEPSSLPMMAPAAAPARRLRTSRAHQLAVEADTAVREETSVRAVS
ncbi:hypothetical protein [Euzebya tangerina]|uniref:hypothetical protein n=1 Tax=Euzebya tangerina TaxID=591198 RepID=UPI00196B5EC0|nr:hypothetical protein [Euzebya tangerina]